MKKELIICCLLIILVFLIGNLQNILNESFSNISNIHNCPPFSVTHKPYNSFMTHSKGWCTDKSYSMKMSPDDFNELFNISIKTEVTFRQHVYLENIDETPNENILTLDWY